MNILTYNLIFISVALSVAAQVLLKKGMSSETTQVAIGTDFVSTVLAVLSNVFVLGGLMAYVSSAAIWLAVLSKIDVSKAYPFVGIGFIGTMLVAHFFLNEPITLLKLIGTLLISLGVIVISQ